jgi:hypothetical protein
VVGRQMRGLTEKCALKITFFSIICFYTEIIKISVLWHIIGLSSDLGKIVQHDSIYVIFIQGDNLFVMASLILLLISPVIFSYCRRTVKIIALNRKVCMN